MNLDTNGVYEIRLQVRIQGFELMRPFVKPTDCDTLNRGGNFVITHR